MRLLTALPWSAVAAVRGLGGWVLATRLRRRVALALVGVTLAGVAVVAAAVLLLMWRLSEGPIRLEAIDSAIEQAVARELGDVRVEIMGAELARESDGGTVVRLADITIRDQSGQFLARAPQALVATHLVSAALGSVVPTRIELIGPHVSVRRNLEGDISLGFRSPPPPAGVGGDDTGAPSDRIAGAVAGGAAHENAAGAETGPSFSPFSMFSKASGEDGFLGTVNRLLVRNARLTLFDEASQSVWDSFNATLQISRPRGGLAVFVDAPFSSDTGEWRFRASIERDGADAALLIDAEVENIVPSEIAARIAALDDFSSLDLPVSGRLQATVSPVGNIEAVAADMRLGAGFLRRIPFVDVEISPQLIDEGRVVVAYLREDNKLDLQNISLQFGSNRIAVSGTVSPELDDAGRISAARFDLRSDNLILAAADLGGEPAVIQRALASGRYLLDRSAIEVDTVIAEFPRGRITLGATIDFERGTALSLQGSLEEVAVGSLLQLWPRGMAPGARAWISTHISEGTVRDGQIRVDLTPEEMSAAESGLALSESAIAVDFSLDGVTAHYLDPLPPLERASGTASLTGDRFVLSVARASATAPGGDPIAVTFGRIEIPSLVGDENGTVVGNIDIGISGSTAAALSVLDLEPFRFGRELGVGMASVGGTSTIIFDLTVPLEDDVGIGEIQLQAGATLRDLVVPGAFRGITLEADELEIIATHQRIDALGDFSLNGVPARASLEMRFDQPGARTNRLSIETEADGEALNRLGIDMRGTLVGAAPMTLEATGTGRRLEVITVSADVSPSEIRFPSIGWSKPAGEPARLDMVVEQLENDQLRLREIELTGDRIAVEGAIRFDPDGSVYKVDISRMQLGPANDLQVNGVRRADGVLVVKVRGREFDAGELMRREIADERPRETDDSALPAEIDFELDSIRGAKGAPLNGARGSIRLNRGKVSAIRLAGTFTSGQSLEVDYAVGGGASPAVVNIETGDAGEFIRFLGLYSRAFGGGMLVRAQGPDARRLSGYVSARDFNIRDEPLLVRIAQGTSGLAARAARDVRFTRLNLEFERQGGALEIKEALIGGPAVGASIRGRVDIAGERLGLSGTYIPAYGLNAAFGAIPLFGPILSGRSGEGVFGTTFGVEGKMSNPTITINPVSAIAPGLLRRFFEFRQN